MDENMGDRERCGSISFRYRVDPWTAMEIFTVCLPVYHFYEIQDFHNLLEGGCRLAAQKCTLYFLANLYLRIEPPAQ